jgi:tetratricopeptide (TPR) repeat protein
MFGLRGDPLDRRSLLVGALVASACSGGRALRRDAPSFSPASFPDYRLHVAFEPKTPALNIMGEVSIPEGAVAEGALTLSLAEDARNVRIELLGPDGDGQPLGLTQLEGGGRELRRWSAIVAPDMPRPLRLSFSLSLETASATLFALAPDFVLAAGVGFAWYPQIVDRDDVRLIGTGEITYDIPGLTVVSSGEPIRAAPSSQVFRSQLPAYFDFAAGRYVRAAGQGDRVEVLTLTPRSLMDDLAAKTERMLRALAGEFGELPTQRFRLVEAPTEAARAAGFDGASLDGFMALIGDYFDQPFNTAFFAHEASHQWWPGIVKRRGLAGMYLLDESLAQYGSLRAVEILEGARAAETYRRIGYPGYYTEYSAFWYLARALAGVDSPLLDLHIADPFTARRVANTKGMLVWDMLSRLMGRRRFADFLSRFVREHAYRRVALEDFMQALAQALGANAWFVEQWFARTGAPTFDMRWRQSGETLALTIDQDEPFYRARLPASVVGETGERATFEVDVAGAQTIVSRSVDFTAATVELDPQFTVLRWTAPMRERAEKLRPYTQADILLNRGEAEAAERMFRAALADAKDDELRFQLLRGLGDAAFGQSRLQEAADHYRAALAAAPAGHEAVPEVWRALGDTFRSLKDRAGMREAAAGQTAALRRLRVD